MSGYRHLRGYLTAIIFTALCTGGVSAQAQIEADFATGGGVRVGWSSTTCAAGQAGAIRYNSAVGGSIDFCNGTLWQNVSGNGSIDSLSDGVTTYSTTMNIFMGLSAGANTGAGGLNNLFIGQQAGQLNTTGDNNIALGYMALYKNATGSNSVAIGRGPLNDVSTVNDVVAIGTNAGSRLLGGDAAILIGTNVAASSGGSGGIGTIAIGNAAHRYVGGNANIAIGAGVMATGSSANSNYNVAIGHSAMSGQTAGSTVTNNVAVGYRAGDPMNGGTNNVILGYNTGSGITTGSRNILIGASVAIPTATTNDRLNIGNLIYGDLSASKFVGINTATPAYTLHVTGDIAYTGVMVDVSDRRRKDEIKPIESALDDIVRLQPVSFVMKDDPTRALEYGFIAQDVQQIYPHLVKTAHDKDQTMSLNYIGLIAPMLKAMQEQQAIIDQQARQIEELTTLLEKSGR